ncbi:MAG: hypothetical protein AAGJ28_17740 [Pseudomonadota bacterium]
MEFKDDGTATVKQGWDTPVLEEVAVKATEGGGFSMPETIITPNNDPITS